MWCDDRGFVVEDGVILRPTQDFRVHIVNASATDQLSAIRFQWERFLTDD